MADQNRAPEAIPAFDETADIIELDDRLDLAFDPLSVPAAIQTFSRSRIAATEFVATLSNPARSGSF